MKAAAKDKGHGKGLLLEYGTFCIGLRKFTFAPQTQRAADEFLCYAFLCTARKKKMNKRKQMKNECC